MDISNEAFRGMNAALMAGYFGASGHSPVIGPKASSSLMTLTTL
jgi:hypothetical protein